MRWLVVLVLVAVGCGAASRGTRSDEAVAEMARLEAGRDASGVLKRDEASLRALGRIGGPRSVEILRDVLASSKDEGARVAAVEGLWFADDPQTAAAVAQAWKGAGPRLRVAVARALGRMGSSAEEPVLVEGLRDGEPEVRRATGISAGIYGRRKLGASDALIAALAENAKNEDAGVRYGAAYGLSYHVAPAGSDTLLELALDADAETRALALAGLSRRGLTDPAPFAKGLADRNMWVQVEAVKALSAKESTPEMRALLAARLAEAADGHPLRVGLERLLPFAKEEPVAKAYARWANDPGDPGCYGKAGLARRDGSLKPLADCTYNHHRFLADAVKDSLGSPAERVGAVEELMGDRTARGRAAGAEAAVALLPDARAEAVVRKALADSDPAVCGSAAGALADLGDKAPAWVGPVLVARVREVSGKDSELHQTMIETLAAIKAPEAKEVARAAVRDADPAVRAKAIAALKDLGEPAPDEAPRAAPVPPPVDVLRVMGKKPVLTVETNRGTFKVELDPEAAPWNVANLVTLSEKGFFDGTLWHRVVPGFVVQGGDPTGTGWGGPGYSVPGEPSSRPYRRGSVGIADAGKDTGGSQWFITHVATPHLDGRYTRVGEVSEADMAVIDALQVGDQIVHVTVAVTP